MAIDCFKKASYAGVDAIEQILLAFAPARRTPAFEFRRAQSSGFAYDLGHKGAAQPLARSSIATLGPRQQIALFVGRYESGPAGLSEIFAEKIAMRDLCCLSAPRERCVANEIFFGVVIFVECLDLGGFKIFPHRVIW
jgi:hypothetical protein